MKRLLVAVFLIILLSIPTRDANEELEERSKSGSKERRRKEKDRRQNPYDGYIFPDDRRYVVPDDRYNVPDDRRYIIPDDRRYIVPDDRYVVPDDRRYIVPDDRYVVPDDRRYITPDDRRYIVPDDRYVVPDDRRYIVPDDRRIVPDDRRYIVPDDRRIAPNNCNRSIPVDPLVQSCQAFFPNSRIVRARDSSSFNCYYDCYGDDGRTYRMPKSDGRSCGSNALCFRGKCYESTYDTQNACRRYYSVSTDTIAFRNRDEPCRVLCGTTDSRRVEATYMPCNTLCNTEANRMGYCNTNAVCVPINYNYY